MRDAIRERANAALDERVFPGCAIGVVHKGRVEYVTAGGLTYDSSSPRVTETTVYDVASVTKSIPTASLALNFLTRGEFELSDPVTKFLPALQSDHGATIEDLLTYRVQGERMSLMENMSAAHIERHILESGFTAAAHESRYSNMPAFVLGLALEAYAGEPLDKIAERDLFMPLHMNDTYFFPPLDVQCAPTEIHGDTVVHGIVHDESARVFAKAGRATGHAGLFSTCADLSIFLSSVLSGAYPRVADGAERGLGWHVHAPYFMGAHASERAFGKTGFTGTSVLVDRAQDVAIVILSNRTYPQRPANAHTQNSAINVFRRDIANIVLEAVH